MNQRRAVLVVLATIATVVAAGGASAADVTRPPEVARLKAVKSGNDVVLSWDAVTSDVLGAPESVGGYRVYRDLTADFVADKPGGSNRAGDTLGPATTLTHSGVVDNGATYYYLATAYDAAGNEGNSRLSRVAAPPVLSGSSSATSIDLTWTDAQPVVEVAGYRLYRGLAPRTYDTVDPVGLVNARSVTGLPVNTDHDFAVSAIDSAANESEFSNEYRGRLAGLLTVDLDAHNGSELCFIGGGTCAPQAGEIQLDSGREILVPVDFPAGNWVKAVLTFTVDSGLCGPPTASSKCGTGNNSPDGWNPCGNPWDRTASVFLVQNGCRTSGGRCYASDGNVELLRTVTPFGTDAATGPRTWTYDVTPLAPLLRGRQYIGVNISTWVANGWTVFTRFHLSEDPAEASLEPPAAGIVPVFFHDGGNITTPVPVTIPAAATRVVARYFITGHGGNPPGTCDEFCPKNNRILVNGAPGFETTPWRDCCYPRGSGACTGCIAWNACGFPSCTYDRSGWCPGEIACHYNLDQGCDQDLDATSWLAPGATYDLTYDVVDLNGSWTKSLVAYWYE